MKKILHLVEKWSRNLQVYNCKPSILVHGKVSPLLYAGNDGNKPLP